MKEQQKTLAFLWLFLALPTSALALSELRQRQNTPPQGSPVMATTPIIGSYDVVK